MTEGKNRVLDRNEAEMVEQSQALGDRSSPDLVDLIRRLRERRDRAQRMIRTRTRKAHGEGQANPDNGAREKKALLTEAIQRVSAEMARRKGANASQTATKNLREAVERKAETPRWTGPENRTGNVEAAETPNSKIAPSGALHAEGMRAAIARSTGDR